MELRRNFLEDDAIVLHIGNRISADGGEHIAISKGMAGDTAVICIKSRGHGKFLGFFPISDELPSPGRDQEITFNLEEGMIDRISEKTGLAFILESEVGGNVCFADSPELRDDFKISFLAIDVLNYSYGALHSPTYKAASQTGSLYLPYPKDAVVFWEMVGSGREIRKI